VRVTINEDATTDKCTQELIQLIKDHPDIPILLFAAIPCTGGSQWQNINRRKPGEEAKLAYHRRIFKKIWKNFVKICEVLLKNPLNRVAIEWPKGCAYWKFDEVVQFLNAYRLTPVVFNGCALNLKSVVYPDKFIPKPWRLSTNCTELLKRFTPMICPGISPSHQHTDCAGRDTALTENYTYDMTDRIHSSFDKHAKTVIKNVSKSISIACCAVQVQIRVSGEGESSAVEMPASSSSTWYPDPRRETAQTGT
jgi:hypothetical protein